MMEKLCKTYSFRGLFFGLFDFFSAVYKFSLGFQDLRNST
jgi:hypothetical protein